MQEPLARRPLARATQRIADEAGTARASEDGWHSIEPIRHHMRLWLTARWTNDVLTSRIAAHIAVLLVVLLAVILSQADPFSHSLSTPWATRYQQRAQSYDSSGLISQGSQPSGEDAQAASSLQLPSAFVVAKSLNTEGEILVRAAVPHTIIPERPRDEITHYAVQSGDTIFGIAAQFGLAPETIMWANGRFVEDNPDLLRVGQELVILPVDGVYHQVGGKDTLEAIASAYKVDPAAIINYPLNNLDPENPQITAGQWLVVPGGTKPYVARTVVAYSGPIPAEASKGTGIFGWPVAGQITQGYWDRHRAIDIGSWQGAPVLAADSGYVVAAGWDDSGYGRTVVIDHGNGFQTLYAHLQVYYVDVGASVAKGQQIGEVGSTGNSTGPHLHLELRQGGVQRNPLGFLP
jgi:murein DD-endopeptidase MepM/ murein hydrolase activator NlpD